MCKSNGENQFINFRGTGTTLILYKYVYNSSIGYPRHIDRVVNFAGLQDQFIAESTHGGRAAVPADTTDVAGLHVTIK